MTNCEISKMPNDILIGSAFEVIYKNFDNIKALGWTDKHQLLDLSSEEIIEITKKLLTQKEIDLHNIYKQNPNMARACVSATYKKDIISDLHESYMLTLESIKYSPFLSIKVLDKDNRLIYQNDSVTFHSAITKTNKVIYNFDENDAQMNIIKQSLNSDEAE